MGSPWPGNVRFLILDHAMARAGFTAHRGHQRRHGAGRLQPWQELSPGRHRRYKAVLYKQNRRAASTERRAIRIIPAGSLQEPGEPGRAADRRPNVVRMSAIGEGMPRQRDRFGPKASRSISQISGPR